MQALGKQCNNMLNSKDSNQKRSFLGSIKDLSENKAVLSTLQQDNAAEKQNEKVIDKHKELYIKDQYSENNNVEQDSVRV